ncbi:hypothetical protein [Actinomadura flavalba]|uniref:hypothetical protein n=1 Tax=Actinomadura flavalba TaxID=1120938 RepID=UPI0003732C94|nr:hypothetical protein [Actinomadura flavalba]
MAMLIAGLHAATPLVGADLAVIITVALAALAPLAVALTPNREDVPTLRANLADAVEREERRHLVDPPYEES